MSAMSVEVAGRVTTRRVLTSEWTKFRSLRSTWWTVGVALVATVGLGGLASVDDAHRNAGHGSAVEVAGASQFGVVFAALTVVLLGALFVTGEYGTGMIRATMTAVPRRTTGLYAKAGVLLGVLLPLTLAASVVAFLIGDAIWRADGHDSASLIDVRVISVLLGAAAYLSLTAVFALAVGTLVRSTAGAVAVLVGVFFIVPSVAGGIPGLSAIAPLLPSNAGAAAAQISLAHDPLPGWIGVALFAGYTLVLTLVAGARLRRRDV